MYRRERLRGRDSRKEREKERERVHAYIICLYTPIRPTAPAGTGLANSVLVATRESKRGESCKVSIHIKLTHSHTLLNFLTQLPCQAQHSHTNFTHSQGRLQGEYH
jgi:hypothetical protein